jgi:hypothetical protein
MLKERVGSQMANSFQIVLEAIRPISHGDTRTGLGNPTNTRLFLREETLVNGDLLQVPSISENALRHVLFREPLANDLLKSLGITGGLSYPMLHFFYNGGALKKGSSSPAGSFATANKVQSLYPSVNLLGGSLDGFILPAGKLRIAAWLLTREYAPYVAKVNRELAAEAEKVSAFELVYEETKTHSAKIPALAEESQLEPMIYTTEVLAAGTKILVEGTFDPWTNDATVAAVTRALAVWEGYIGGQGRMGRGRMAILSSSGLPTDEAYSKHIDANKEVMRAGIMDGTLGTDKAVCAP